MEGKVTLIGSVEAIIKNKDGTIKSVHKTNNTVVKTGQDHVADLLSRSFLLNQPHETTDIHFVDYMSIGAGMLLSQNSVSADEVYLPWDPKDGNEPVTFYDGCAVHCVSGANQGEVRAVQSGGYNNGTRRVELSLPFSNVPLIGDVYTITTTTDDTQLQGEGEVDQANNVVLNPKKPITLKVIKTAPFINEVEFRAEWIEAEGDYIVGEAGLWYNLSSALPGQSSTQTIPGTLFAKGVFLGTVPQKTSNDILEIRWTIRVGAQR